MPGQAVVTIGEKQWVCAVASTPAELTTGLSGIESIPAGTGMLFDLGADYKTIRIDMTRMLFALDIVFINSAQGVVGVMRNVQPGETDVRLENETLPGARWFLEVTAGEAEGVSVGDDVIIQDSTAPAQLNLTNILNFALAMMVVVFTGRMAVRAVAPPKPQLYGPRGERLLPAVTLVGVGRRPLRPEEVVEREQEKLERRRRGLRPGTRLELVGPEEHARMIETYEHLRSLGYRHTESVKMVADRLGRSKTTVLTHVLRGRPPERRAITPDRLEEIKSLRRRGLKRAEIARRLGVDRSYVTYLLHRAGEKVNVAEESEELHRRMLTVAERLSAPANIPQLRDAAEKLYEIADDAALLLEITAKIPMLPEYFPSHPFQIGFRSTFAAEVLETGIWCLEEKEKGYSMREYHVDGWEERPSPHTAKEKEVFKSCAESAREAALGYLLNKPGYESKMAQHNAIIEELLEETE
jgi:uncharacterized membrane protein (UPF0127 family)/transcriptional regulator with XRE-family HTH domain